MQKALLRTFTVDCLFLASGSFRHSLGASKVIENSKNPTRMSNLYLCKKEAFISPQKSVFILWTHAFSARKEVYIQTNDLYRNKL